MVIRFDTIVALSAASGKMNLGISLTAILTSNHNSRRHKPNINPQDIDRKPDDFTDFSDQLNASESLNDLKRFHDQACFHLLSNVFTNITL